MPPVPRPDPYAGYAFLMTVNGISDDGQAPSASFREITIGTVEVTPIEYRNGSQVNTVTKLPGLAKYDNLVCKRGITGDLNFWNWILAGINGSVIKTGVSVALLDEQHVEVVRWNFRNAWPTKLIGPGLNATNNEVAMETIEIAHEGVEIDQ